MLPKKSDRPPAQLLKVASAAWVMLKGGPAGRPASGRAFSSCRRAAGRLKTPVTHSTRAMQADTLTVKYRLAVSLAIFLRKARRTDGTNRSGVSSSGSRSRIWV